MRYGGYQGYGNQMAYGWGFPSTFELFFFLVVIVVFVDAVLLGIWLWKQIQKK